LTVGGGNTELPALRAGLGVGLLPDFAIWADVKAGRLDVVKSDWRAPDLTLHLLTPPGRGRPKRLEVFTDFLVKRFGGRMTPWAI
jgi:DNA-binding transcriptional LysR family regulator